MLNTARILVPGQPAKFCSLLKDTTLAELEAAGGGGPPNTVALVDGTPASGDTTVRPGSTVQYQPVARNG